MSVEVIKTPQAPALLETTPTVIASVEGSLRQPPRLWRPRSTLPATVAAWVRRAFWRIALMITGGVEVTGALPSGGCVVVANHSSHADSAALLAGLDARHRPRVAAAADYWFRKGPRALLCRMLAGGFPVRRNGGGSADLAQATQLLRAGHAVIIYPEGTRSRRGRVGSFHLGPARLARAAGVPLVPVGLSGTARLLPAGGRLRPGPVSVRIGAPIAVPDTEAGLVEATRRCRVAVIGRCALPISKPDSVARRRISRLALSRWGVVAVAQWSFAEGLWWPLVPEVALFIVLLAAPQRWRVLIPVAVLANVAGGLATLILTGSGISTPQPLVTDQMRQTVSTQVREGGVAAVEHQPLAGIPFKVYAAEAGRVGLHPVEFARESLLVRGTRIAVLGLIFAIIGTALRRRPQAYPYVVAPALLSFLIGLGLVVVSWS